MTARIRRHVIVHGRVQGVGFRWATAIQAQRLGVAGRAENRGDGTVEVVAEGDPAAVQALLGWLRRRPAMARVDRLDIADEPPTDQRGFHAG